MYTRIEHPTVSVLHGRWGSGKSTFAKAWLNYLDSVDHPAIYFDAFASDLFESPFEAISGEIVKEAVSRRKVGEEVYKRFLGSASRVGRSLAISVGKIAVKAATLGAVGAVEIEKIGDDFADAFSDQIEDEIKSVLERHAERAQEFDNFKRSLSALATAFSEQEDQKPLIFIVDELDRCRPDFALGLIETLKHVFLTENIHFVIVTNLDQLELSVEHRYGSGAFSSEYLEKFFDFAIQFDVRDDDDGWRSVERFINFRCREFLEDAEISTAYVQEYISDVAKAFGLTLRQIERFITNVAIVYAARKEGEEYDPLITVYAIFLKIKSRALYAKARSGSLTVQEMSGFLDSGVWSDKERLKGTKRIFQFYLDPSIDVNTNEWSGFGHNYRLSRLKTISYYIRNVVERFHSLN